MVDSKYLSIAAKSTSFLVAVIAFALSNQVRGSGIWAGAAKVEITNRDAAPVNDPLFVKALVIKTESTTIAMVTVDAVAIGEIGHIKNDYLPKIRSRLQKSLNIQPGNVLVNASHCHGIVCSDVDERTFQAVKEASQNMVPVIIGVGHGSEERISENRRLTLRNGREADVRHAYSLPPDEEAVAVGPIDPEIGVLRFDRTDGRTLAVVYNFACHPIQGVPGGGNTADITGFASKVIEENLHDDTIALFLQGCAGDVNPLFYKDVNRPRDAEPLGNRLGLSTLRAVREIQMREDNRVTIVHKVIALPRADLTLRIGQLEDERETLVQSLRGTTLNLKQFVPLFVKYHLGGDYPSYDSHRYLHDDAMGREDFRKLDEKNYGNLQQYIRNIHTMEALTRLQTNLRLLKKHHAERVADGTDTIQVELLGLRIGDFVLTTFPGELSVQIGLNIKKASPHPSTFVAGYTNGYIYYAPTSSQLKNVGGAQEDSDCLLAHDWQKIYEQAVAEMLGRL